MSSAQLQLFTLSSADYWFCKIQFTNSVRIGMYQKVISFLKDGVPLHEVVTRLGNEYLTAKPGEPRGKVLTEIAEAINQGKSFAWALSHWAPTSEVTLIQSGEDSGNLISALENAVYATESNSRMRSAVIGALAYPTLLIAGLLGLLSLYAYEVMPAIAEVADPDTWDASAQSFYGLCQFVKNDIHWALIAAAAVVALLWYLMPRLVGPVRSKLDVAPPFSLYRIFHSSIFLISLSAMMASGRPLHESIETIRTMANPYVRDHLNKILGAISAGRDIGSAMNTSRFLGYELGVDVKVYAATGDIKDAMKTLGESAIEQGIRSINAVSGLLKSGLMFAILGVMAWAITSVQSITQIAASVQ